MTSSGLSDSSTRGAQALRGVPTVVIAAWLGHAKASFTQNTYLHSQADELRDAGNTLTSAYAS